MEEKIVLGIMGGFLLAYGYMQKNKKIKHDQFMNIPDPSTQTEGNICLVLGVVFILGTLLA